MCLRLAFYGPMLSGCRKFCDNHLITKLFFKRILDVLIYRFCVASKKLRHLLTIKPDCLVFQLNIKLNILIFEDYNFVIHSNSSL